MAWFPFLSIHCRYQMLKVQRLATTLSLSVVTNIRCKRREFSLSSPYCHDSPVAHGSMVIEKPKLPSTMKAVRFHEYGKPEVLQLETEVPVPEIKPTEVLIRVFTIGVNPYDTYQRSGSFAGQLPGILGTDCAGIIAQTGPMVKRFNLGDRVFTTKTSSGSYAEYVAADEAYTFPLHDRLTFSQGAALGVPYFTAYKSLVLKASSKPGDRVLVHGASGGVGIACCQIAKGLGLRVIGTAGTDYGISKVLENGAEVVFNHREDDYVEKIKEHVGNGGVDIICEMNAAKNWNTDLSLLAKYGRLIVIGSPRVKASFYPSELIFGEKRVEGVAVFSSTKEEYAKMAEALHSGVDAGWVKPIIRDEFPLKDAAHAHHEVMEHKDPSGGKLILSIC